MDDRNQRKETREPNKNQTRGKKKRLTRRTEVNRQRTYTIQRATLALQRVDHVERRDGLALGVLRVRHSVADHALQEQLEHTARLVVDQTRDTLDTATARETADGGLSDTLNVVAQDLAVTLRAALTKTLSTLALVAEVCLPFHLRLAVATAIRTSRHGRCCWREYRDALWPRDPPFFGKAQRSSWYSA